MREILSHGANHQMVALVRSDGRYLELDQPSRDILDGRFPEDGGVPLSRAELARQIGAGSASSMKRAEEKLLASLRKGSPKS